MATIAGNAGLYSIDAARFEADSLRGNPAS